MPRFAPMACIAGYGRTRLGKLGVSATTLMQQALESALSRASLRLRDLDGLIAVPSLSDPHFMEAHALATSTGLLPQKNVMVRTIDTGGAGPVSGLLEARRMVLSEGCVAVAVVAGDAVSSLDTTEFLARADQGFNRGSGLASPCIPHGYNRVAEWQMETYGVTREQLAMVSVLMSRQASRHPAALTQKPHTLADVLSSKQICSSINLLECARRADGGACVIVASSRFLERGGISNAAICTVVGGGEASGPLIPPPIIDESMFSCEQAAQAAYYEAQLLPEDIDWFGLYDCYPACFIRAVEACGLAPPGGGGRWCEDMYHRTHDLTYSPAQFPVNTHGGLLAFGAPWEVPAMYNIIEACQQLERSCGEARQVPDARRALVYGNGGIFSHSAVAILSSTVNRHK
jgi:acetyl-CoA acetyltransferase